MDMHVTGVFTRTMDTAWIQLMLKLTVPRDLFNPFLEFEIIR